MVIIGGKEEDSNTISVRKRKGENREGVEIAAFIKIIKAEIKTEKENKFNKNIESL